MVIPNNPIMQADMDALAALANANLLPLVNSAIAANENGWADSIWQYSGGTLVAFGGINVYDTPVSMADGVQGILSPQPAYVFDITKKNWASELNRIRGDIMALVFQEFSEAEELFQSPDALLSGPWLVGINDPATYDMGADQGKLFANNPPPAAPYAQGLASTMCTFAGVKFYYSAADSDDLSIIGSLIAGTPASPFQDEGFEAAPGPTTVPSTLPFTLDYDIEQAGNFVAVVKWSLNGTVGSVPNISLFTVSATPATGVVWSTENGSSAGHYNLVATITLDPGASVSDSIVFSVMQPAADYFWDGTIIEVEGSPVFTWFTSYSAVQVFDTITDPDDVNTIQPISIGAVLTGVENPVGMSLNGNFATIQWVLSDPTVKGVWQALTLPVPGRNFYLDQDFPPFVSKINPNTFEVAGLTQVVGISNTIDFSVDLYYASSMRQRAAILDPNTGLPLSGAKDSFGLLQSSMAARPAPFQVLRDTDFVPFSYGFNQGDTVNLFQNVTAAGDGSLFQSSGSVPADATQVRIRCVKAGTGGKGWRSGVFGYGVALTDPLTIYVKQAGQPSISDFDFKKTDSEVTIEPDGGTGYLAEILNGSFFFAIQNTTGADVQFDLLVEIDTVASPARQYFPGFGLGIPDGSTNVAECFSHSLDGTPSALARTADFNEFNNKPVPQSGHCIFKLRATRLPALNGSGKSVTPGSGAELVATVGQNKLQMDGSLLFTPLLQSDGVTPFTISIAADARDSGDVAVFWPVLAGNEIVYQCASQIILEAWADWQPLFFNPVYGLGYDPLAFGELSASNVATAWQYALGFVNWFNKSRAGYPTSFTPADTLVTQFPVSVEIYNDLFALLNLL